VVIVDGGWQAGAEEKNCYFCDKLTHLGWLTHSVLKYSMKTKRLISEVLEKMQLHFFSSISE
jgi:hypothetical protein